MKGVLTSIHNPCLVHKKIIKKKNEESNTDYQLKNDIPKAMKVSILLHRYVIPVSNITIIMNGPAVL